MIHLIRTINESAKSGFPDEREYQEFTERYVSNPLEAIRAINKVIKGISTKERKWKYIQDAVSLETITERDYVSTFDFMPERAHGNETKREHGIPGYLLDGFVDMGFIANDINRGKREKIVVDKKKLRNILCEAKMRLADNEGNLTARIWRFVRSNMRYDEEFTAQLVKRYDAGCIGIDKHISERAGICIHLAVFYQIIAQEAGLESGIQRGQGPGGEMHAWDIAHEEDKFLLVDTTKKVMTKGRGNVIMTASPFIIPGGSITECYLKARRMGCNYRPKVPEQSYYKYKKLE